MQTNDYYLTEIITWNHIIISIRWGYLKPYNCLQSIKYWIEMLETMYLYLQKKIFNSVILIMGLWDRPRYEYVKCTLGIPKNTRNRFRYKTFIYLFEFKVFQHEERVTQFLSILTFPFEPHHMRHPCRKLLVWPRRAPKIDFLVRSLNLNSNTRTVPVAHKVIWPRPGLNLN